MRAKAFILLTTAGTRAWWAWEANHTNVTTPPPTMSDSNGSVTGAPSWFPGFGSTPIGDPPPGSENLTDGALNWGAWSLTILFGWVDTRVFSTPSSAGMLNTEGGGRCMRWTGWASSSSEVIGLSSAGRSSPSSSLASSSASVGSSRSLTVAAVGFASGLPGGIPLLQLG